MRRPRLSRVSNVHVGRIKPEVEVEVLNDDGEWRDGPYYRQQLADGWWYHVRVYWPPMHVRLLCVRYPDQVRLAQPDP
jgi:hypothetical protein